MRKPDHFTTFRTINQPLARDILRFMAKLVAVSQYAEKNKLKLDDVRDQHETAALAELTMPPADIEPETFTVVVDFATGELAFKLA